MRQRIDQLEVLVKKLIAEGSQSSSPGHNVILTPESSTTNPEPPPTEASSVPDESEVGTGRTVVDGIHSMYLTGDDWYTVLEEVSLPSPAFISSRFLRLTERQINELKTNLGEDQDDPTDYGLGPNLATEVDGTGLLFNEVKPIDRIEILSSLPPKAEVDRLVSWFFGRRDFPITIPRRSLTYPSLASAHKIASPSP